MPSGFFDFMQANQIAAQSGAVHVHLLLVATQLLQYPCFAAACFHGISEHRLQREMLLLHFRFFDRLFQLVGSTAVSIVCL